MKPQAKYDPCPDCGAALMTDGRCYVCGYDDLIGGHRWPFLRTLGCAVLMGVGMWVALVVLFTLAGAREVLPIP